MLGVRIGTEYLELQPGTEIDLTQENPFLQFGDELLGDFSMPFEVKPTPHNLRLLEFAGLLQKRVATSGLDAVLMDGNRPHSIGKVKVERPEINMNTTAAGSISLYYLSGVASFFQDIKDRRLREIDLGGERSFPWYLSRTAVNGADPTNNSFWAHIHRVMEAAPNTYDYAIFPVINKIGDEGAVDVMNKLGAATTYVNLVAGDFPNKKLNPIVPFVYLHLILKQAFALVGWQLRGDILNDDDFRKIVILNSTSIDWAQWGNNWMYANNPVKFDLVNHIPDWTIADFLINLKKRLGLWFDFDRKGKVCQVEMLKDVAIDDTRDLTRYASPVITKQIEEGKQYALKTSDGEKAPVAVAGRVVNKTDLPAAAEARHKEIFLVIRENAYYICHLDDSGQKWQWNFYGANNFNYETSQDAEEILTKVTTVGNEFYSDRMDFIPRYDAVVSWGGGGEVESSGDDMPLVFFHGAVSNRRGWPMPYASAHPYYLTGQQLTQWALTYECKLTDGTEVGLYHRNWKPVLDLLTQTEHLEATLHLPVPEYLNLKFSDVVSIKNVRFYIKTIRSRLPYRGEVVVEGVRL